MPDNLKDAALKFHSDPSPGKLAIQPTKPLVTQRDLSLAYSPGVAHACTAIAQNSRSAYDYTSKGNMVAVISNGTAVLGLGAIGALASKPVMEGKAVLFKKFANIDVFDIEIDELDTDELVETIARLAPTFGGINLEDIKAPECFEIEKKLQARLDIPVFHDDQHGTAICVAAAVINAVDIVGKTLKELKFVCSGAGASAIACLDLLINLGVDKNNIFVCDSKGLIHKGRNDLNPEKKLFALDCKERLLEEVIIQADVFLGLSGPGILSRDMVANMAADPVILALANPDPEILPEEVRKVRSDAIIATGRSDYPNQVNNVLCFPFIFRGALDCGASEINLDMKLACVKAIANLAKAESSDVVTQAYGEHSRFGADYIIPRPFDPRLIYTVPVEVARAAMDSGVAQRPIKDLEVYRENLEGQVFRSGSLMKHIFAKAKVSPKRVVYAVGEDDRVLQAVQQAVDEKIADPILIGRPFRIQEKIESLGLRIKVGTEIEVLDPANYNMYREYSGFYHDLMGRAGAAPQTARIIMRTQNTAIAAMMVRSKDADAMIAGPASLFRPELIHVLDIIGLRGDVNTAAAMQVLILDKGIFFITDTHVMEEPSPEEICQSALLAAEQIGQFGVEPKIALLSGSNFGSNDFESSVKMREAVRLLHLSAPNLEVDGEMHADTALRQEVREELYPNSRLSGQANTLVMPNLTSANIAYNMVKALANGISVGPMLLGLAAPAHVLHGSATVRTILNMTALSVVDAQKLDKKNKNN